MANFVFRRLLKSHFWLSLLTLRAYRFDNGDAVNPWANTLNNTVTKTTVMNVVSPGNTFNSSKAKRASTMDAKPLGPNHPINNTVSLPSLVPISDTATGNILITVKLKIE